MQECIEKLLVTVEQGIKFMWKCKDHMEVGGVDDFRPALIHPDLLVYRLTVGAVTVPVGIVVEFKVSAVRTLGNVDPQCPGLAGKDGPGSFLLYKRGTGSLVQEILIGVFRDTSDLRVIYPASLPSFQRGLGKKKKPQKKGGRRWQWN